MQAVGRARLYISNQSYVRWLPKFLVLLCCYTMRADGSTNHIPGDEKLAPVQQAIWHPKLESTALQYMNPFHPPQTASTCLNPHTSDKISTPRRCVGSSSSFRADVGLGAQEEKRQSRCKVKAPRGKSPCLGSARPAFLNDSRLQMSS